MTNIKSLIPLRQAARMAGMGTTCAYQVIAAGQLATATSGRRRFAKASELQRFIDALPANDNAPKPDA